MVTDSRSKVPARNVNFTNSLQHNPKLKFIMIKDYDFCYDLVLI